jgi:hypothetical protein
MDFCRGAQLRGPCIFNLHHFMDWSIEDTISKLQTVKGHLDSAIIVSVCIIHRCYIQLVSNLHRLMDR